MALLRSWGDKDLPILVILECPTKDDEEAGCLMSGWYGRFLKTGLDGEEFQVITVFDHCLSKPPTAAELGAALEGFQRELMTRNPQIIVPLGSIALEVVAGSEHHNIMDWRGYFIKPDSAATIDVKQRIPIAYKTNRPATKTQPAHKVGDIRWVNRDISVPVVLPPSVKEILPTITTQTVQKSNLALMSVMYGDLHKALKFVDGAVPDEPALLQYSTIPVRPSPTLIVDIETTYNHGLTDIGLATEADISSTEVNEDTYLNFIPHFNRCETLIAHNAAFEFSVLSKIYDLSHVKLWDTMLAAYMLEPDGKKSLNWVISQYLVTRRHKHLADDDHSLYNALDVAQTRALYTKLHGRLAETGQLFFFQEGMMPAIPTLTRMAERGIPVDTEYAKRWQLELTAKYMVLSNNMTSAERVMYLSPKKLAAHLGVRNADEEQLLKLKMKGHPENYFINNVLALRALAKESTYVQTHDRVFPNYLPGTRDTDEGNKGIAYSGRPTASKPNIQNQPPDARRQFIAKPGHTLVSLDWSQIEPRITAALSGDDNLASDIEAGLYDAVANTLSCPRSVAKTVVLLSAYLGSPKTLQNKLMLNGIIKPYGECKALQDRMFARYKDWKKWREGVIYTANNSRFLQNCFGKRAPFVRPHPAKAANFHPQSTAACILWYCLPQVERAIAPFDATIVTTVHDEILLEAPTAKIYEVSESARTVMNQEWPQVADGFRVPVKVKVGSNWRDVLEVANPWNSYEGL